MKEIVKNIGMHSHIYEPTWSRHFMMIDTIQLYILILMSLTLTFIQGHRDVRKYNLLLQLCHEVSN